MRLQILDESMKAGKYSEHERAPCRRARTAAARRSAATTRFGSLDETATIFARAQIMDDQIGNVRRSVAVQEEYRRDAWTPSGTVSIARQRVPNKTVARK